MKYIIQDIVGALCLFIICGGLFIILPALEV